MAERFAAEIRLARDILARQLASQIATTRRTNPRLSAADCQDCPAGPDYVWQEMHSTATLEAQLRTLGLVAETS